MLLVSEIISLEYILCLLFERTVRLSVSNKLGSFNVPSDTVFVPFWIIYQDPQGP